MIPAPRKHDMELNEAVIIVPINQASKANIRITFESGNMTSDVKSDIVRDSAVAISELLKCSVRVHQSDFSYSVSSE